jgi:hypothetical protein
MSDYEFWLQAMLHSGFSAWFRHLGFDRRKRYTAEDLEAAFYAGYSFIPGQAN